MPVRKPRAQAKPLIFLDCDGVINGFNQSALEAWTSGQPFYVDPKLEARLVDLVDTVDAKIVVVSTWRLTNTRSEFCSYFSDPAWMEAHLHRAWRSPFIKGIRGGEVDEWYDASQKIGANEDDPYDNYVILDDSSDYEAWHNLLQTNGSTGLSDDDIAKAKEMLIY